MTATRPVHPGDVYRFIVDVATRSGLIHCEDSIIRVLRSTSDHPFGTFNADGTNWLCETKFGTSVWTSLDHLISTGRIVLVDS